MKLLGGLLALALALGISSPGWAQDSKSGSKSGSSTAKSGTAKTDGKGETKSESTTTKEKEGKARGVLPMYYRQIGLSEEQRQKIYKIQNEYSDKVDDLEKRIEAMKAERNSKYLKELTKAQRDRLEELKKGKDEKDKDN